MTTYPSPSSRGHALIESLESRRLLAGVNAEGAFYYFSRSAQVNSDQTPFSQFDGGDYSSLQTIGLDLQSLAELPQVGTAPARFKADPILSSARREKLESDISKLATKMEVTFSSELANFSNESLIDARATLASAVARRGAVARLEKLADLSDTTLPENTQWFSPAQLRKVGQALSIRVKAIAVIDKLALRTGERGLDNAANQNNSDILTRRDELIAIVKNLPLTKIIRKLASRVGSDLPGDLQRWSRDALKDLFVDLKTNQVWNGVSPSDFGAGSPEFFKASVTSTAPATLPQSELVSTLAAASSAKGIYLSMGILGTSIERNHQNWIEVTSYDLPITRKLATNRAGTVTLGEISFTKFFDKASPYLWSNCLLGKVTSAATIQLTTSLATGENVFMEIKLSNVTVTNESVSIKGSNNPRPTESFSLKYSSATVLYKKYNSQGLFVGNVSATYTGTGGVGNYTSVPLNTASINNTSGLVMKTDGIAGEALDIKYKGWVWNDAMAWSISRSGSTISIKDPLFSRAVDSSTPQLWGAVATGKIYPLMEVAFAPIIGETRQELLKYKFSNVIFTSETSKGGVSGVGSNIEQFTINFTKVELTYTVFNSSNTVASKITKWFDLVTRTGG